MQLVVGLTGRCATIYECLIFSKSFHKQTYESFNQRKLVDSDCNWIYFTKGNKSSSKSNELLLNNNEFPPSIKASLLERSGCDHMVSVQVAHRSHEERIAMLDF